MKSQATKTFGEEDFDEYSLEAIEKSLLDKYTIWREEFKRKIQPVASLNYAWVVYAGTDTLRPQAAFTNRECADQLVLYMQGAADPVRFERSAIRAMNLVVDKYEEQVSFGKMPYEIILDSKGQVFDSWGPSDGIPSIEEPVIMNEKLHALAGTFWGWTGKEAIENAQQLFWSLREKGEI